MQELNLDQLVQGLRQAGPFRLAAGEDLEALSQSASQIDVASDQFLIHEGDPAKALYVVSEGELAVFRDVVGAPQVLFARLHAGDFFGHIALFGDLRHSASVRASVPSRIIVLPLDSVRSFLDRQPKVRENLADLAAEEYSSHLAATLAVEQSRQMRVRLHHEVVLDLEDGVTHKSLLHNLSVGGFCLENVPEGWVPGAKVHFGLGLGNGRLELGGEVVWRRGETVGLRFTQMTSNHDLIIQLAIRLLLESSAGSAEGKTPPDRDF